MSIKPSGRSDRLVMFGKRAHKQTLVSWVFGEPRNSSRLNNLNMSLNTVDWGSSVLASVKGWNHRGVVNS